ncbi:hypothetical protein E1218_09535 [Kribbella turkmenica]|uniref:Uncharacterized protein n=1 Tax=Kribbella turkmenica TaxID=2530375 RepID=A0A4R4XBA3_9ACTN|nr:hypothetical protein [Kribbella turkmenica]TDD27752.1 hypothetical protein E1218_09535 [Kribbella turkmenica]
MRKLGWIGIGCCVLALVVSGYFVVRLTGTIPGAPTPVGNGAVSLDGPGLTIFAAERGAGQPCTAKDANGTAITLEEPSRSEQWDVAGEVYYVVAHSVHEIPAQSVEVTCAGTSTTYYAGRRHTADVFLGPALSAAGSFLGLAALGAALIVVDQARRKRALRG